MSTLLKPKPNSQPPRRYRRFRQSPAEIPRIPLAKGLLHEISRIVGARLGEAVLAAFPAGCFPTRPEEFHALEQELLRLAQTEVAGRVLAALLTAAHGEDRFLLSSMAGAAARQDLRPGGRDRPVRVRLPGGVEVRVETPYMVAPKNPSKPGPKPGSGERGKGGGGLYPVLSALGVVGRCTPWVASSAARSSAQLASYDEAATTLKDVGLQLNADVVRTITHHVADAGLADRERAAPIDRTFAGKRVSLTLDGGRLRCRHQNPGTPRKSGFHGFSTPWREPKVAVAHVVDAKGKLVRGSSPVYEATLESWEDAITLFARTLRRHGIEDAESVTILADGSNNIWNQVEALIEGIGVEPARVTKVLDFYHAMEHLHDAAKLSTLFASDLSRKRWVTKQEKGLKEGAVQRVLLELAALPVAGEDEAKELLKEVNYLSSRVEMIRYDTFLAQGTPIGSGAVESAIRRIVNLRIKGPGVFWKPENAERILYLRCRLKAGRWNEVEAALHQSALYAPNVPR
ncbi:MAG: hypothetical protein JKY65_29985 [Planctomycetes bacterium]|nr:hypothetical protein [Planctomycetota bacterium]